jgi:hypothetical protein
LGSPSKIKAEYKKTEQDRRNGWLNMVYEEIQQHQLVIKDPKGGQSEKGIITETITRFQSSLPWLN